jgi:hypothetical protein
VLLVCLCHIVWAISPDCDAIKKEVRLYQSVSPSGFVFPADLKACGIVKVNGLSTDDYIQSESDAILALIPLAISKHVAHPLLLDYMLENKRWDLLISTLDTMRHATPFIRIQTLHHLFYKPMPPFMDSELKEIFNFFSPAEKITMAQQLIPGDKGTLRSFKRRHAHVYEFWPLFDQMVLAYHARILFPNKFDSLVEFWDKQLLAPRDTNAHQASFQLLNHLLNGNGKASPDNNAVNASLQGYYFVAFNRFDEAKAMFLSNDTAVFFNVIRYFNFFKQEQQDFLLSVPINWTISDVQYVMDTFGNKIQDERFSNWIWSAAKKQSLNCDEGLARPYDILTTLPKQFRGDLTTLSPITDGIQRNKKKVSPYFYKKGLLFRSSEYPSFESLPPKTKDQVVATMLPHMRPISLGQWVKMAPHLTMHQHLDVFAHFPYLHKVPTKNRAAWNRYVQPKLARLNTQ